MNTFMRKNYAMVIAGCFAALILAGCGSDGGTTASGSNGIGGNGNKGPFRNGSTVTAHQLNTAGARTGTTATATVTDNLGTYSLTGIAWAGATEVVITGNYFDETTGTVTGPESLSAITVLPAIGTVVNSSTVNPNIASDAVAKLAKSSMSTASAAGAPLDPASAISSSNNTVLQAFGIPIADSTGAAIDAAKLDLTKPGDATFGTANAQLLVLSAALKDATATSAGTVAALIDSLVTDMKNGNALGTSDPLISAATINTSIATANTNAATIAANISSVTSGQRPAITTAQVTAAVTTTQTNIATALKGYALSGNTFTIGTVAGGSTVKTYTMASTGAATAGAGSIQATDVVFKSTFKDYTNAAGTGAGAAQTTPTTFDFYIASTVTGDSRKVSGSLSPVKVTTDGAGSVAVTVPANAVLTYSGTDSLGATISGTATALSTTIIQANASALTINANALLTTIQNKVGNASLNVLSTAGTFSFEFGLGLNIGHENGAQTGIDKLFQTGSAGAKVSGRRVYGSMTTI